MNTFDLVLLWILTGLALVNAVMRILLSKKQGTPLSPLWMAELFIFPALLGIALVLYQLGIADVVFQAVALGLLEEIVCIFLRRRWQKSRPAK